jgi:hypothetical protein
MSPACVRRFPDILAAVMFVTSAHDESFTHRNGAEHPT